MTATGHAIIGTVIAAKIGNPALAIPIALVSHIAADIFPHWDAGTNSKTKTINRIKREAVIDVLVGFAVSYLLIHFIFPETNLIYAFILIIAAQGLDWVTAPSYMLGWKFPPFNWFYTLSDKTNTRMDKPWGIIGQVWVLLLLIGFAVYL